MIFPWNNQSQRSRSAQLILTSSLSVALMLLSACEAAEESTTPDEPNEPNDPSCVEMGPSPSEACQQRGLALSDESSCAQAECQMITYETTCSGSQEALCLMMNMSCEAAPLSPELVCATEDLVLATDEECAEVECQQVSSSVCGETSSVLCRASDAICEEVGYPAPGSICEAEGLTLATEAECAEVMCQVVEFEIACGETAEVLCRAPGSAEPLPEQCADRGESQCGLDDACRWLIPEPWACAEPEELLPQAGCFPITSCRENGDCGEGEECRSVAFGECDQPGDLCEACATYDNLCLPVSGGEE